MNINANELLLLNKKVRFGENTEQPIQQQIVEQPTTQEAVPQAGMNALMFQGMSNVASNPQLAGNLNVLKEEVVKEEQPKNEQDSVAPLKTNVAFQGKASRFKNVAMGALMGLMTLGSMSALQSCQPDVNVSQTVDIDMSTITELISQMQELMKQMKEQQEITNSQLQTINSYLLQLMQEVQDGNINQEQFYQKMYAYMIQNESNQEIIIQQLVNNGKSQEEANTLIQDLIAKVESGQISAQEAMETIQNLLGDIKGLLGQVISSLTKAENDRAELIELAKQGNANTSTLIDKANEFIESNNAANTKLDGIKDAIEKANMDSNANFETVVKTLKKNKEQLIGVMLKLGFTQAQIEKMTAAQILAAIKENTQVTKDNNAALNEILTEVKSGKLSAEEASKKILKLLQAIKQSIDEVVVSIKNHYHNDANVTIYLQKIQALLEKNNEKTDSTNTVLNNLYDLVESQGTKADAMGKEILNYIAAVGFEMNRNFGNLIAEVEAGNVKLDSITELLTALNKQVKQNGDDGKELGNNILNYLGAIGFDMNRNFTAVLNAINTGNKGTAELKSLLEKVLEKQDQNMDKIDTNGKAIIEAMGNIEIDGVNIDLSSLEEMMSKLLTQAEKNGNILSNIDGKADVLNLTTKAILAKLEDEAGKNDVRYTNIKNLLKAIGDKIDAQNDAELLDRLDKVLAKLDEIKDAIKNHKVTVDVTGKVECNCNCGQNHEGILGDIEDILE